MAALERRCAELEQMVQRYDPDQAADHAAVPAEPALQPAPSATLCARCREVIEPEEEGLGRNFNASLRRNPPGKDNDLGIGYLSLASSAGAYVGSSSGFSLGHLLGTTISQHFQNPEDSWSTALLSSSTEDPLRSALDVRANPAGSNQSGSRRPTNDLENGTSVESEEPEEFAPPRVGIAFAPLPHKSMPPKELAKHMLDRFFAEVNPRYPFLYQPAFMQWHDKRLELERLWGRGGEMRREEEPGPGQNLGQAPWKPSVEEVRSRTWLFFIWSAYAIGSRILQLEGFPCAYTPQVCWAGALEHTSVVLRLHSIDNIRALLLFCVYTLRSHNGPGLWHLVGMAMRMSTELGLHRQYKDKEGSTKLPLVEKEMRKSRSIDITHAWSPIRHFGHRHRCRDVSPNATNEIIAAKLSRDSPLADPSTSLTSAIRLFQLRRIESLIGNEAYSVTKPLPRPNADGPGNFSPRMRELQQMLEKWKSQIPFDLCSEAKPELARMPWMLLIEYNTALLLLLRPFITHCAQGSDLLSSCAAANANILTLYKEIHSRSPLAFPLYALHQVFLSGVTLIYCLWVDRNVMTEPAASAAIRACSIVLYIISDKWPSATKYRDTFERLASGTLPVVSASRFQSRQVLQLPMQVAAQTAVPTTHEQQPPVATVSSMPGTSAGMSDVWNMLDEMTGTFDVDQNLGSLPGLPPIGTTLDLQSAPDWFGNETLEPPTFHVDMQALAQSIGLSWEQHDTDSWFHRQ
ncbi:hypothetical protein P7C73_g1799, partial [Tremellales sp. Uapishka_1]